MSGVIRRALGLGGAIAALALFVSGVNAAAPEGPRLAFVRFGTEPAKLELVTSGPDGLQALTIAGGSNRVRPLPFALDAPSWSPDGGLIAFAGWPGKVSFEGGPKTRIYVVAPDGSGLREVPGTKGGFGPVFAPDGRTIAFARTRERGRPNRHGSKNTTYRSTTAWLADLGGSAARRLTPWRNGLEISPTSFSPDGAVLALVRQGGLRFPEVVATRMDGTGSVVLARDATDAVYSPDGSEIAFLGVRERKLSERSNSGRVSERRETTTDLFAMRSDGSEPRRLTHTPGRLEVWPSWDPSGQQLAFARLRGGGLPGILGFGDQVVEINRDGTCARTVLAAPRTAFYGPTWQPGPGREAGRIEC